MIITLPTFPFSLQADSRSDDDYGGDNPGVGGIPAEGSEKDVDDVSDDDYGGDNPGVGGMPAEKPLGANPKD